MAEPYKLDNGRWRKRVQFKDPITNTWKEKMLTEDTKKVDQKAILFLTKVNRRQNTKNSKLLDYFDEYVETFKKGKVSNRTLRRYNLTRKKLRAAFQR